MISYLIGLPRIDQETLTLLVGGVGYEVHVGPSVMQLASPEHELELYIHTHVREDALELFGFTSLQHRSLFRLLIAVSGIGPKTALMIIDRGPQEVARAVQEADTTFFSSVPRVGKKTAQKIIIELRSKLGEVKELSLEPLGGDAEQVRDALVGLGFPESQVIEVVRDLDFDTLSIEAAVKQGIKQLGSAGR